ncbi:unnamed protein product [Nezara viridula]|uniref:Uncharacterized protein n=1 Tax=Nezara viridula TaxID=85310 RepID=A0A9P0HIN7_NEZVI|nr:unnamed protein product [Nezara viridula]
MFRRSISIEEIKKISSVTRK